VILDLGLKEKRGKVDGVDYEMVDMSGRGWTRVKKNLD
jgi:hypothetical protein